MIKVVNFDYLPSQQILSSFIDLPDKDAFNNQFLRLENYNNAYMTLSLGTLFIFFLWHLLLLLAYLPIKLSSGISSMP